MSSFEEAVAVWVLGTKHKKPEQCQDRVKIVNAIGSRIGEGNVRLMYYEDLTIKVDAEGLYLYEKGVAIKPPKVILNRIASSEGITEFIMPLLRQLEYLGVIICNSSNATMLATHKFLHLQELASNKIPIASTFSYSAVDLSEVNTTLVDNELGYPQIMKSVHGSQGSKVVLLPSPDLVTEMKHVLNHEVPYLFQDYIKESHGRDMRVFVVDNEAVFAMIRSSNTSSVKANLSAGGTAEVVTGKYPDAEALAVRICHHLKMDIAGVDLLFSDKYGYVCCEVNNCPGLSKSIYEGTGVEYKIAEMIVRKLR